MNLSKLTNPAEPETKLNDAQTVTNESQVPPAPITAQTLETDSTIVSHFSPENDEEVVTNSGKDVPFSEEAVKERSPAEYRELYQYLLEKYKNVNHTSQVLEEFESYLKRLYKYQQLRNNMLIDTLKYLDHHETFESIDNLNHVQVEQKLKNILKRNDNNAPLLKKLIELEKAEKDDDSRTSLNTFNTILGINDSLSNDLSLQESNTSPDLYTGKYDFFELVKKNQFFENNIQSYLDLQNQIQEESKHDVTVSIDYETQTSKKRNRQSIASNSVSKAEGPGDSLKVTIQRKKKKIDEQGLPPSLV